MSPVPVTLFFLVPLLLSHSEPGYDRWWGELSVGCVWWLTWYCLTFLFFLCKWFKIKQDKKLSSVAEGFLVLNSYTVCACLCLSWKDIQEDLQIPPPESLAVSPITITLTQPIVSPPLPSSQLPHPLLCVPCMVTEVTPVSPPRFIIAFISSQLSGSRNQAALCTIRSNVLPWTEPGIWNKPVNAELHHLLAAWYWTDL